MNEELMNEWRINEWMNKWMDGWMNGWINEWISDWWWSESMNNEWMKN